MLVRHLPLLAIAMLLPALVAANEGPPETDFVLQTRRRVETEKGSGQFRVELATVRWPAAKTAVVVCDMWDKHWCQAATRRVNEMAPRMNEVLKAARARGALIIHAPSDCMEAYADTPQRKMARQAPVVATKRPLERWCHLAADREPPLPIDDSQGGCDDQPPSATGKAWSKQHAALEIHAGDAVTDSAEAYYLMQQRGITNVLVMGVHTNMCVLGRPFSIRQLVYQGQNVLLVRDMTDAMYDPRQRPQVTHARGTELVVEHIEKYWCPSVLSSDLTGLAANRFADDTRPHVALAFDENHYEPQKFLPAFADELSENYGCRTTLLPYEPSRGFAGLSAIEQADTILVYLRREPVPTAQVALLQKYLAQGKPLVALRTASHGFSPKEKLPPGFTAWEKFDAEILGGSYAGHFADGTEVFVTPEGKEHPILSGIEPSKWTSTGALYKTAPVDSAATILLRGTFQGGNEHPVAWTRQVGSSRVFYASLGHGDDFGQPHFRRLLAQALFWSMNKRPAEVPSP